MTTTDDLWLINLTLSTAAIRALIKKGILDREDVAAEVRSMKTDLKQPDEMVGQACDDALTALKNMPGPKG
jgi:hypothetical protein